jgi:hypothetical protein
VVAEDEVDLELRGTAPVVQIAPGLPGIDVRSQLVKEKVLEGVAMALRFRLRFQAGNSYPMSVSFRISKYSMTVVRGTCASLATAVLLNI